MEFNYILYVQIFFACTYLINCDQICSSYNQVCRDCREIRHECPQICTTHREYCQDCVRTRYHHDCHRVCTNYNDICNDCRHYRQDCPQVCSTHRDYCNECVRTRQNCPHICISYRDSCNDCTYVRRECPRICTTHVDICRNYTITEVAIPAPRVCTQFGVLQVHITKYMSYIYYDIVRQVKCLSFSIRTRGEFHLTLSKERVNRDVAVDFRLGRRSSILRTDCDRKFTVCEIDTPEIFCDDQYHSFWLTWRSGRYLLGKKGHRDALLTWQHSEEESINYFGIRAILDDAEFYFEESYCPV